MGICPGNGAGCAVFDTYGFQAQIRKEIHLGSHFWENTSMNICGGNFLENTNKIGSHFLDTYEYLRVYLKSANMSMNTIIRTDIPK